MGGVEVEEVQEVRCWDWYNKWEMGALWCGCIGLSFSHEAVFYLRFYLVLDWSMEWLLLHTQPLG